jgi:hypothetical protein
MQMKSLCTVLNYPFIDTTSVSGHILSFAFMQLKSIYISSTGFPSGERELKKVTVHGIQIECQMLFAQHSKPNYLSLDCFKQE